MKPIQLVAICVICTAMMATCSAACDTVVTIRERPDLIPVVTDYNETNLTTVQHFLDELAPCPYQVACGGRARYVSIQSEIVGLDIGEVTIQDPDRDRVRGLVMNGHRVNTFVDGDTRYYTTNLYNGDSRIVTRAKLNQILDDFMTTL